MADTIELLEAIGCDASLRHASAQALAAVLENAKASLALTTAVVTGDPGRLKDELDYMDPVLNQASQTFPIQL